MKKAVLVVDDDPKNRKLLRDLLGVKGYAVVEAMNGREGVKQAQATLPDLILLDMQMPVMDGFDAVRMLKGNEKTKSIPIWALTSYAMAGDEKKVRAVGCDSYITKPIDTRDFLRRVDHYFSAANKHDAGS